MVSSGEGFRTSVHGRPRWNARDRRSSQCLGRGPESAERLHQRGDYRRLGAGAYRVMYVVEDDIITIERVDLVI